MRRAVACFMGLVVGACTPLRGDDEPIEETAEEVTPEPVGPIVPVDAFDDDECFEGDLRSPFAPVHDDLAIELEYLGPPQLEPGERIEIRAAMRNDSDTTAHPFVMPGDGSESGWREPIVGFLAMIEVAPDCWQPVQKRQVLRCGLFDSEWTDDIVTLAPGARHALDPLWAHPSIMLGLDRPGRIRLQLHYVYSGGRAGKGAERESRSVGAMKGVDAFELVSNTVELTIVEYFRLDLRARKRSDKKPVYLRDVVELDIRNVSADPRAIQRPTSSSLRFEVSGTEQSHPAGTWEANPPQQSFRLRPGAAMPLLGDGRLNPQLEFALDHPKPENVRIRATYQPYADRPEVRVVSDWVDVDLGSS